MVTDTTRSSKAGVCSFTLSQGTKENSIAPCSVAFQPLEALLWSLVLTHGGGPVQRAAALSLLLSAAVHVENGKLRLALHTQASSPHKSISRSVHLQVAMGAICELVSTSLVRGSNWR